MNDNSSYQLLSLLICPGEGSARGRLVAHSPTRSQPPPLPPTHGVGREPARSLRTGYDRTTVGAKLQSGSEQLGSEAACAVLFLLQPAASEALPPRLWLSSQCHKEACKNPRNHSRCPGSSRRWWRSCCFPDWNLQACTSLVGQGPVPGRCRQRLRHHPRTSSARPVNRRAALPR